jgi:hypothetical protein
MATTAARSMAGCRVSSSSTSAALTFLAAPVDQVFDPVRQRVVAVAELDDDVAGSVEAVGGEHLGVPLGCAVVAADRVGPRQQSSPG